MPLYVNPAEFLLNLTSFDFSLGDDGVQDRIDKIHRDWKRSAEASTLAVALAPVTDVYREQSDLYSPETHVSMFTIVAALLHRSFIKSYRDIVVYGIRFVMYIGLAIMMGTVWLRLSPTQSHIQPFINAIVGPTFGLK